MGARITGRIYDMMSALSVTAMMILVESPAYLLDSGFLLSFGCVLGMGAAGGRGKYGKLPRKHPCRCFDFRAAAWILIKSKSDTMKPGLDYKSRSGFIHVILIENQFTERS